MTYARHIYLPTTRLDLISISRLKTEDLGSLQTIGMFFGLNNTHRDENWTQFFLC